MKQVDEAAKDYAKDWFLEPLVQARARTDFKAGVSWTLQNHPDVKALVAAAKQLSSFVDQLTVMDGSLRDPISDAMNELEEVLIRFEKGQADE